MTVTGVDLLYRARKGVVDFVDVPELGFVTVAGRGAPDGDAFAAAVQALYSVSFAAHFLVKKEFGAAAKVLPLEALWWQEDAEGHDLVPDAAFGFRDLAGSDRDSWCWQAMIPQSAPVDEEIVARAMDTKTTSGLSALAALRFQRWTEGFSAQIMHIGPYADEGPTIARLHTGIADAGYRPRGRHHEIYLGDPRRSAPERLRTLLRHAVEPV